MQVNAYNNTTTAHLIVCFQQNKKTNKKNIYIERKPYQEVLLSYLFVTKFN
jgi:hypothetical protein